MGGDAAPDISPKARASRSTCCCVWLAEHLAKPGEVIPLILDDVTVQCDTTRTARLLEILHRVSRDRQVILFTQEDDVLQWPRPTSIGLRTG